MLQRVWSPATSPSNAHSNLSLSPRLTQMEHRAPHRAREERCYCSSSSEAGLFTVGVSGLTPPEKSYPGIFLFPTGNPERISPQPL